VSRSSPLEWLLAAALAAAFTLASAARFGISLT
jgi:hypothetical protein